MTTPFLSICVPSRNRQKYFRETIAFLLENPRPDVEFVFADNSDDASVIESFLADKLGDPRIVYLKPAGTALPMHGNWERTVAAATGDWVTVIGDDDLIDPDVVDALKIGLALKPDLEAFSWSTPHYSWVMPDSKPRNIRISLAATFHDMPKAMVQRRAYRWDDAGSTLTSGFSIYHSAISRSLIERGRKTFGGRHFEHHTPDYENLLKNVALGSSFLFCQRPFSIYGTCPESNTAAIWNPRLMAGALERCASELGHHPDEGAWMKDFPFQSWMGVPAAVVQVHQWMRHTYNISMPGWEANFVRACSTFCSGFADRESFELLSGAYETTFQTWRKGAFRQYFNPVHRPVPEGDIYTGTKDGKLYVRDTIGGATSPAGFYRAIVGLLERPAELAAELRTPEKDSVVLSRSEQARKIA